MVIGNNSKLPMVIIMVITMVHNGISQKNETNSFDIIHGRQIN
jgi:hypothetical protein